MLKENVVEPNEVIGVIGRSSQHDKPATDKSKILAVLEYMQIPYEEIGNSIVFSGRRYFFDPELEEVTKITNVKRRPL